MQRRQLLKFTALGLSSLTIGPTMAWAATVDSKGDPFEFILNLSNNVLDAIRSNSSLKAGDVNAIRQLVDSIIMPNVDFTTMTRMTIGPKWRTATAEQRQQLQDGFQNLLMRVYAGALSQVKDEKAVLRPTRDKTIRSQMIIRTLLQRPSAGGNPIGIDYRIYKDKTGAWRIVDVNIEGIWLVENYQSQFAPVLNQSGVEGLIKLFQSKGDELAKSMKSPGAQ